MERKTRRKVRTVKDRRIIEVKLTDVAKYERATKDKVYKAGTVLVQVSATRGQVLILDKSQTVETHYVAIEPIVQIMPYYLFLIIEMAMPEFTEKYQTGLNIQADAFKFMRLRMHTSLKTQAEIANEILKQNRLEYLIEKAIEQLTNVKANMLDNMFVGDIDKKKDREYLRKREV